MTDDPSANWPRLDPVRVGFRGRCPRCGSGHLFAGFLKLRPRCEHCGLSFAFADPADGPAFFILCFGCLPAFAFAIYLQVHFDPPLWVHLVTSLPLVLLTCIPPLRPLKGWLVAMQFHYRAREAGARDVARHHDAAPHKDKTHD
jgi:uncharacterized protein (DUF983 family)